MKSLIMFRAAGLASLLSLASLASFADVEFESVSDAWYVGVAGELMLPQGGSKLHRIGGAALRGGYYLTDHSALEGEVGWLEDACALAVRDVVHFAGWGAYDELFGYSRFDPFFTVGARGWIGRSCGQVGPEAGLGAFYHLTDEWSLRADAGATLGLESNVEMLYTLSVGVQYSF